MIVRPGWWRLSTMIPLVMLIGLFGALAVSKFAVGQPGQAAVALVGPVLVCLIAWLRTLPVRLEVTDTAVRAKQGGWRRQPDKQVSRSEIRAIHYFPMMISFRGPDNESIMMIEPHWTRPQMLKVADELKIPLYDHTRWLGMRKVSMGRLTYDPASRASSGLLTRSPGTVRRKGL